MTNEEPETLGTEGFYGSILEDLFIAMEGDTFGPQGLSGINSADPVNGAFDTFEDPKLRFDPYQKLAAE